MERKVMKLADIKPAEYNPRVTLTEKDYEYQALSASLDEFGLVVPLILNGRTGNLVSGHQRLNMLMKKGVVETDVVVVDMDPEKEKALCIAMNKVSGSWDYGKLADILEELQAEEPDMTATGFTEGEIAELLGELGEELAETPEVDAVERKDNTKNGVPCRVGEYEFKIEKKDFEDMIADIREKVGFSKEQVCKELERRIFG